MRADPLNIIFNKEFIPNKNIYLISGNETSLIEKVKSSIVGKYRSRGVFSIANIETIKDFVNEPSLFEGKKIFLGKQCKGLDESNLNKIRNTNDIFIFIQENTPKIKKIKNLFLKDSTLCLVDCYELNKESKIKILNYILKNANVKIEENVYWFLVENIDNKYIFLENSLRKIFDLDQKDISLENIKKLLTIDSSGKERLFFWLLKKNKDIIRFYRNKIFNSSDVNELYYYCRFFCLLIIDCDNEDEYKKRIPTYLFKDRDYLIDFYRRYNFKKKGLLIRLLSITEKILRKENGLSTVTGLRFLLNIKKITVS